MSPSATELAPAAIASSDSAAKRYPMPKWVWM
jgi:hypothetical protein